MSRILPAPVSAKRGIAAALAMRLLVFAVPLVLLYGFARHAIESASRQPHHGDTGMGIALLLGMLSLLLLAGFLVDLLLQLRRRRLAVAALNAVLVLLLLSPFGWVACNWFGFTDAMVCRVPMRLFEQVLQGLKL